MKPRRPEREDLQGDLFKVELVDIVDARHAMVKLADSVAWSRFDEAFGGLYVADNGSPAKSTRLMVALHYLKYAYDLSDEQVVAGWVENPYWQYLSGMKFFEHRRPLDPSSMTRWRQRVGEAGAETLLRETIATGLAIKAVKPRALERINVDTTVQEKHGCTTGRGRGWSRRPRDWGLRCARTTGGWASKCSWKTIVMPTRDR